MKFDVQLKQELALRSDAKSTGILHRYIFRAGNLINSSSDLSILS
ncbi:hypothetical protein Agau_L100793 [Agrobacterium tumefaciens F2]|nr:hypothetical protein Agau_L100793 [Agrobacterium tumefaciens F2]